MHRHDRRSGGLGELDCSGLDFIARPAWAIGRETNILSILQQWRINVVVDRANKA